MKALCGAKAAAASAAAVSPPPYAADAGGKENSRQRRIFVPNTALFCSRKFRLFNKNYVGPYMIGISHHIA
jgi:hypothetical protein